MRTSELVYELPGEAIAQVPTEPRDRSRLLDGRDMTDHRFFELPSLLEPGDLVVVNDTRVRPARLVGTRRDTGGRLEVLLLNENDGGTWEALIRPGRRMRPGIHIDFAGFAAEVRTDPQQGKVELAIDSDAETIALEAELPLPPYIHEPLQDPDRYQTIFAHREGSAAAPTAGLHFTNEVLEGLEERDIGLATIDLEVGLDTFRPITAERIEDHVMHSERFHIPAETSQALAATAGRVVAIGTTVVRALETPHTGTASTSLFIAPGYRFRVVDLLVTNFHSPASSLLALVAALVGEGWRSIYATALERGYRFLSFGDAMLLERQ